MNQEKLRNHDMQQCIDTLPRAATINTTAPTPLHKFKTKIKFMHLLSSFSTNLGIIVSMRAL